MEVSKIRKDIPKDLVNLIESCMEKAPSNRLKSADELINTYFDIRRMREDYKQITIGLLC